MPILLHRHLSRQALFAMDRPLGRRLSLALDFHLDREESALERGDRVTATFHRLVRKGLEFIA